MELPHHDRLCSWLGLPPGSWPPDHYALLGLTRGAADPSEVEGRVLDRMERLRAYQLLHPELVTEGMNRLAQALVCLTDPVARAAYDRSLGVPPPPFEVVEDEPAPASDPGATQATMTLEVPFAPGLLPPVEAQQPAYEVVEPNPLPYEVVDEPAGNPAPRSLPYEVVPEDEAGPPAAEVRELRPVELPAEEEEPGSPFAQFGAGPLEPAPSPGKLSRRGIYRRLAALRAALRAWEGLRPVMGTPAEALATPVAVLLFVRALAAARAALPRVSRVIRGPGTPGGTVAALVGLPHALHAIRALLPSQRQAVALDWHRGHEALQREYARLRELSLAARVRRPDGTVARIIRALRRTPEWLLFVVALAAFLAILARRNP